MIGNNNLRHSFQTYCIRFEGYSYITRITELMIEILNHKNFDVYVLLIKQLAIGEEILPHYEKDEHKG